MSSSSPITKSSAAHRNDFHSAVLLYTIKEVGRVCVCASIFHSENMFLKSVAVPTLFLFALWSALRVHKLDCFQLKLNQKTCFWTVPNVLQPLMAVVTSSIPLHPPALNSVDIGSSVPTVSLHRPTPVAGHYLAVWVPIQILQPDSC